MNTSENRDKQLPCVVLFDAAARVWQRFMRPREIVACEECDEVPDCLRRVERLVESENLFAAGFVSYEAAPAFDRALAVRDTAGFPLVWFGLFADTETIPPPNLKRASELVTDANIEWASEHAENKTDGNGLSSDHTDDPWQPSVTAGEYAAVIAALRERIAAGETYQVNYTFRLRQPAGDPWAMFARLIDAQPAPYPAYIETEQFAIASASPELFFELDGRRIVTRPMKGTAPRGLWPEQDRARAAALAASEKDRAENAMIVDMMRNDLGRIAARGSVRVSDLFRLERYATLWQMTSRVAAETGASLAEIFAALFPCASITGAPKASTMRIIAQTETAPRRVYTGSIGLVAPGRRARFSVAIRTVVIDKERSEAEYGVGGGVVWDSTPAGEYDECLLKARVLTSRRPEFSLLETLLWRPGEGYWLLDEHLHRLRQSAEYFDIPLDEAAVVAALDSLAMRFGNGPDTVPKKVRLLVDRTGNVGTEFAPFDERIPREPIRLELARHPVDMRDVFLYHKTTHRVLYDAARAGCTAGYDVLLYNGRGEITETGRANVALRMGGELWTPPVSCGLLAGTLRARLLAEGKLRERVIPLSLLESCHELFALNSVRGLQGAYLVGPPWPGDMAQEPWLKPN